MLNSQLFTFVFAFVLFLVAFCVSFLTSLPAVKRMEDLDSGIN
jgi:hypothetical protein